MPTFYNYTENGIVYSFDDVFVSADAFKQGGLWTWGLNGYGQLGDNTAIIRSTPVTTFSGGANWKEVSAGSSASIGGNSQTSAVKTDGTLWTWGLNSFGQLGSNTTINRSTPITTFAGGTNWKQVSCGGLHTIALNDDGANKRLYVWGSNDVAQLGTNWYDTETVPGQTSSEGTNWKQVSCGQLHTLAVKTDGTLWGWGRNNQGQLGDNTVTNRNPPVTTFAGGTDWKQVSSGGNSAAAVLYIND